MITDTKDQIHDL